MSMALASPRFRRLTLAAATDEGLRLFFPLAAVQAGLWPFLWAVLFRFGLPVAGEAAPGQWHAQEMIFGAFGAALLGFLLSALPEWTETPRLSGRPLLALAGLWGLARIVGLIGAPPAIALAGLLDFAWLAVLPAYVLFLSVKLRSTGLLGFIFFLVMLAFAAVWLRYTMLTGDFDGGEEAIRLALLSFAGLLGLALSRITVPVTNLMLDPTEETSPYRPHPARINLAPGLAALAVCAQALGASQAVTAYLVIAAGAAFLDRVAEGFVGPEGLRWELAGLWLSSALAGFGLILGGLVTLGLDLSPLAGLHLLSMGGLGLGLMQVLSTAGLLHTGQPLRFHRMTRAALWLVLAATALRIAPEFFPELDLPGGPHGLAALFWALAFGLWLRTYLPLLWSSDTLETKSC